MLNNRVYATDWKEHQIKVFTANSGAFVLKWGKHGSWNAQNGELSEPHGIAIDKDENIYVADTGNNRIQKFTSQGQFLTKWGSQGNGDGQFANPEHIAVDSAKNVYVLDNRNNRIQKFTPDGQFLAKWGWENGSNNGQVSSMVGSITGGAMAIDSFDNIYIADTGNNRIQKFTPDGQFLTTWGCRGSGDGEFNYPINISIDSSNKIYVLGRDSRIQKFTSDGQFLNSWTGSGDFSIRGETWQFGKDFYLPSCMAVDLLGNLYIADVNRMQKFGTGKGNFVNSPDNINNPLVINLPFDNKIVKEGELLQFTISGRDPDEDQLSYSAQLLNGDPLSKIGASFNETSGEFIWQISSDTVKNKTEESFSIVFSASDGKDGNDSKIVTIAVQDRQPPSPPIVIVNKGGPCFYNYSNNRGVELSFTFKNEYAKICAWQYQIIQDSPTGKVVKESDDMYLSESNEGGGTCFISLNGEKGKTYYVGVRLKDTAGIWSEFGYSDSVAQIYEPLNFKAEIISSTEIKLTWESSAPLPEKYLLVRTDNLSLGRKKMEIPATNIMYIDKNFIPGAEYGYTLVAYFNKDLLISAEEIIQIPSQQNLSPVLKFIDDKTIKENQLLQFTVPATDPDGDALIYSALNLPAGASLGKTTGVFSWTPDYTQAGNYQVTFNVSDGKDGEVSKTITIIVDDVNQSPVAKVSAPNLVVATNQAITLDGSKSSDPDGNETIVKYSWNLGDTNIIFGKKIIHKYLKAGKYAARITVTDNKGATATDTCSILVKEPVPAPATPLNLSAKLISSRQVKLTWKDNSNNEVGFKVEKRIKVWGYWWKWQEIATVKSKVLSYNSCKSKHK